MAIKENKNKPKKEYTYIDIFSGTIYVFDKYRDYRKFVKKGVLPKNWKGGADMRNITEPPSIYPTTNPNSVEAYHQSLKGGAE